MVWIEDVAKKPVPCWVQDALSGQEWDESWYGLELVILCAGVFKKMFSPHVDEQCPETWLTFSFYVMNSYSCSSFWQNNMFSI